MTEKEAMKRALELARGGWGQVSPNPMVGAVLLKDGEVVGEGCHCEFGNEHAEVQALAQCDDPTGTTMVVTLEPCSHYGKTPPCAQKILEAGVRRVVYAVPDPSKEAGGGGEILQSAGVEVESGLGSLNAAALIAPFLWSQVRRDRPFVALKMAASLDGFATDAAGRSQWISAPEAREYVHWLRAGFDAVGVGRGTAEADDPQLTVRGDVTPRVQPCRVIFGRSGTLPAGLKVSRTSREIRTIFVAGRRSARQAESILTGTAVEIIAADDLTSAMSLLCEMGIQAILVEGGPRLAGGLLDANLVDRIYWIQGPILLGRGNAAFGRREGIGLPNAARWIPTERRSLGDSNLLVVDREICLRE